MKTAAKKVLGGDPRNDFYVCVKRSLDGNNVQWDSVLNLTLAQATDLKRFPPGIHHEADGRPFTYGHYHYGLSLQRKGQKS